MTEIAHFISRRFVRLCWRVSLIIIELTCLLLCRLHLLSISVQLFGVFSTSGHKPCYPLWTHTQIFVRISRIFSMAYRVTYVNLAGSVQVGESKKKPIKSQHTHMCVFPSARSSSNSLKASRLFLTIKDTTNQADRRVVFTIS